MRSSLLVFAIAISTLTGSLSASKPAHSSSHKVRKGETAARIARDNGLSLAELTDLNPRLNLHRLPVGAVVKVAGTARAPRKYVEPMAPLPATPAPGPSSLTHLEHILPSQVRDLSAAIPAEGDAHPALAGLQPILPPPEAAAPAPVAGFEPCDPAHLDLLWPVETRTVSSAWGPRMRSRTIKVKAAKRRIKYRGSHKGVDLTAPKGTDVFAAMDGQVIVASRQKGYGNYVMLDHGNGVVTLYGHHNRNFVKDGEIVRRGQKIAEVGRTGNATGPHLHFELRVDGAVQNPLPYLNETEEIPADQVAQNQAVVAPKARH